MMEFSENEAGLRSKLDGDSLILINRAHRNFVHFADNRKANDREALQYFADVIAKEAAWADYRAGRKALCRENENPSFTMNEESMRAIQERASELKLELLESFGIIKKRQKAKVIA
jgi:restriction endonuclease Mrr